MKLHQLIVIALLAIPLKSFYAQGTAGTLLKARKVANINSKVDDYGCVITQNRLTMYFVSNRFSKIHMYVSKRKAEDAPWSDPEYCKITSNPQDIIGNLSLDGIGRFYFGTNRETRTPGDVNIWEGFGLDSSTPTIRMLPPPVNTYKWESQPTVTADGNDLYFASNRGSPAGSIEMLNDIYVTHRKSDGSWTEPQNLGSQVNIGIYNSTPYITPDGHFLFYSSKEKKGTEIKRKIYMVEHTGNMDRDWAKPVLLPEPINSDKDDMYPVVASDGKTIFFSSNRESGSGLDIYQAELPPDIQALIAGSYFHK